MSASIWDPTTPILSAIVYADFASTASGKGAELVGLPGTSTNVGAMLGILRRAAINVEDPAYGASTLALPSVNTAAIQAAVNAAADGGSIYLPSLYSINDEIIITKRLTVYGPNGGALYVRAATNGLKQTVAGKACFLLRASAGQFAFGEQGILGVKFVGLNAEGPSDVSFSVAFARCDTAVNSGNYHVRECLFESMQLRWFTDGINLTGIAYLNNFVNNSVTYCGTCVKIARGAAPDNPSQTRFVGGFYGLSIVGLSLNEDGTGGSFGLHGVSVSENSTFGVRVHEEAAFYSSPDCEFESNVTAGVYVEIKEANPASTGVRTIGGKFLTNGSDIWINKTTTTFAGGGFHFPCRIDDVYLGSATALQVNVPAGHAPIDSPAFILGRNISGPTGPVTSSQISTNFAGTDERKGPFTRRYVLTTAYVSGNVFAYLPFGLVVSAIRMYFTANASGFTNISLGDQASATRYLNAAFNAQVVALNTWQNGTITLPQLIIDNTNNQLRVVGSGGWLTSAAVVEIQGYVT